MNRFLCIHAHFYQPPRENPWLEEVELQDSAYPFHDWNARIAAECYEPNTASRILDGEGRIVEIVNNYSRVSFNFGPTLLSWAARHRPYLHQAIVDADRLSRERFSGHGSALAQVYHHLIMPLANRRDKQTQIRWGIQDFVHRFGRDPEGMWLAETAVDLETLDLLAEHGIRFTILAPHQAQRVRSLEGGTWCEVEGGQVDPKVPYRCELPSGRTIALFFYDGPVSQEIAFSGLLNDGRAFADRLVGTFAPEDRPQLVHVATDGETYGHHHPRGDMALAYGLHHLEEQGLARISVYGEFLERHPPTQVVEIHEESSWSCAHGVERWRADCGCNSGAKPGWNQAWRRPLRDAMDWLRDTLAPAYEREMALLATDPWAARDDYVTVLLDRGEDAMRAFLERHAGRELDAGEKVKALKLLELQRHALMMYTSCGWFFDEVSGIETVQVMQYASRALQLARETCGIAVEPGFRELLGAAPSNLPEVGTAAGAYDQYVTPAALDLLRVGSHYAISSLFEDYPETATVFCYSVENEVYERHEGGRQSLALGRARVRSQVTWEETEISFGVLHLGDHNVVGGVREFLGEESFRAMTAAVNEPFLRSDVPEVIRVIDQHFGDHTYSLWHLFRDEQRKVLDQIRYSTLGEVEAALRQIYQHNYPIMNFLRSLHAPLPKAFRVAAEYAVGADLVALFEGDDVDLDRLGTLIDEVGKWDLDVDRKLLRYVAAHWLDARLVRWAREPGDRTGLEEAERVLSLLRSVSVELDLWRAQNLYFAVSRQVLSDMGAAGERGEEHAREWLQGFARLGELLGVKVAP